MTTQVPVQTAISFISLQILKIDFDYKFCGVPTLPPELKFNLKFSPASLTEKDTEKKLDKVFGINFVIEFIENPSISKFIIEATAIFESSTEIDDNFLNSDFAKINAPAIAFPFLRAFVSTFSLNAGYSPIVLPAFNFSKVIEVPSSIEE
jgi:preprotein translocase subunit SecB